MQLTPGEFEPFQHCRGLQYRRKLLEPGADILHVQPIPLSVNYTFNVPHVLGTSGYGLVDGQILG